MDVPALMKVTSELLHRLPLYTGEEGRRSLLQQTRILVRNLETPAERISHMAYSQPATFGVCRVLIDLGIFKAMASHNSTMNVHDLSETSKADPELLARLMKQIAAEAFVTEVDTDTYAANDITRLLATAGAEGMMKDCFEWLLVAHDFPAFFRENAYTNPKVKQRTLFQHCLKTDKSYFEWIAEDEVKVQAFHDHMSFKTYGMKWFEDSKLVNEIFGNGSLRPEETLLVDVGGSSGHDLVAFRTHTQRLGGLILQDLPDAIKKSDIVSLQDHGIHAMGHDFFNLQPIEGAKAYFLKMVLHNWPDEECQKILTNLRDAMTIGYSRILLNEMVIPEISAHWFETSLDLQMLAVHSSRERREYAWRELVEGVDGLRVKKIWTVEGAIEKIIEIERIKE